MVVVEVVVVVVLDVVVLDVVLLVVDVVVEVVVGAVVVVRAVVVLVLVDVVEALLALTKACEVRGIGTYQFSNFELKSTLPKQVLGLLQRLTL